MVKKTERSESPSKTVANKLPTKRQSCTDVRDCQYSEHWPARVRLGPAVLLLGLWKDLHFQIIPLLSWASALHHSEECTDILTATCILWVTWSCRIPGAISTAGLTAKILSPLSLSFSLSTKVAGAGNAFQRDSLGFSHKEVFGESGHTTQSREWSKPPGPWSCRSFMLTWAAFPGFALCLCEQP